MRAQFNIPAIFWKQEKETDLIVLFFPISTLCKKIQLKLIHSDYFACCVSSCFCDLS